MDLPWGNDVSSVFATNVGLVTSNGFFGQNIMACEWTHHVSYSPGIVAVCIKPDHVTYENIKKSGEFGVSICSSDQSILSSMAGGSSGKDVDKIKVLEELGYEFYNGENIDTLMVKGAVANIECRLVKEIQLGDHTMFVGEVLSASRNSEKEPLAYHAGKYWMLDKNVEKPSEEEREKMKQIVEKYRKK